MPNYEQGTLGKLIVQDWDVVSAWSDTPLLFILTRQQAAALVALCPPLKWKTRWEHPPAGDVRDAFVAEMMFNLMNPITCAMLQACLQELFDAQTADITNVITNITNYGTSTPGQPMTAGQRSENLAGSTNPMCDQDVLWAQCLAIVQYTNRAATDIFEKVEAVTNSVELAGLADDLPIVGVALKLLGAEFATNTVNYFQEAIAEGYAAEYTTTKENELACQLFCLCRDDCVISIDRIYDLFWNNVRDLVPSSPGDWVGLLALLAGIDATTETVVDLTFWMLWGSVKLASVMFEVLDGTSVLQLLLDLAVNDANNDWELLCDCIELTWCKTWDFSIDDGGWTVVADTCGYVPGVGFVGTGAPTAWIQRLIPGGRRITSATATVIIEIAGLQAFNPGDGTGAFSPQQGAWSFAPSNDVSGDGAFSDCDTFGVRAGTNGTAAYNGAIVALELCGDGLEPDWGIF